MSFLFLCKGEAGKRYKKISVEVDKKIINHLRVRNPSSCLTYLSFVTVFTCVIASVASAAKTAHCWSILKRAMLHEDRSAEDVGYL